MAETPTHRPGAPCLVVLASPDVGSTAHFYGGLFGWSVPPANGGFMVLQLDGRDVAGMLPLPEQAQAAGATSRWLVYMAADDIGRRLERVRPAGGTILAPAFDVPGAGRMAMVADATGAEFGLWEAWGHPGAEVMGEPGSLTWAELYTRSKASAANFYTAVLDWEVEAVQAGEEEFISCSREGVPVAGMIQMSAAWGDAPSHWMPYFATADADTAAALAEGLGGEVAAPPHDTAAGRLAVLRDPLGALFFVVAETESPED